jgi:hypothetical protein
MRSALPTTRAIGGLLVLGAAFAADVALAQGDSNRQRRPGDSGRRAPNYPLVFDARDAFHRLGIAVGAGPLRDVERCFWYGSAGHSFQLSRAFVRRHAARGFSVPALCLAMVSGQRSRASGGGPGMRYDPETGRRLGTFVIADVPTLRALRAGTADAQPADRPLFSAEYLMSPPACFKNARPYSDCRFRFDPSTGDELSRERQETYVRIGKRLEELMETAIRLGQACEIGLHGEDRGCANFTTWGAPGSYHPILGPDLLEEARGFRAPAGFRVERLSEGRGLAALALPREFLQISRASLYTVSFDLPFRYGYALYADGLPPAVWLNADGTPQRNPDGTLVVVRSARFLIEMPSDDAIEAALSPESDGSEYSDEEIEEALR